MKKEEIVKKILIRSLAGFPVGVTLLMLAYASVYFIVGDTVFNTELNQLHNINTLLTQIISVGISGYMLFAIFGIINVSGNKEVENNLIKKYPVVLTSKLPFINANIIITSFSFFPYSIINPNFFKYFLQIFVWIFNVYKRARKYTYLSILSSSLSTNYFFLLFFD